MVMFGAATGGCCTFVRIIILRRYVVPDSGTVDAIVAVTTGCCTLGRFDCPAQTPGVAGGVCRNGHFGAVTGGCCRFVNTGT